MKIAFIRRRFSPSGGAELYLQRLMEALVSDGHQIHLYAEKWQAQLPGIVFHTVPVSGLRSQRPVRFALAVDKMLSAEEFDCVFSLERTLKQHIYRAGDGVHCRWLLLRMKYAPVWKRFFIGLSLFHRNMLKLEASVFNPINTGRIIVNSEMVRREIHSYFRYPDSRIHLVRNGVDISRFSSGKRDETRARFGLNPSDFVLLFVGSGWERKGLQFLVPLMKRLRDYEAQNQSTKFKLLVAGKGNKPLFAPENIIFAGQVKDIQNLYSAADLFVFLPIYEPSANVVYEALASNLPVITSATNGASELIQNGVNGAVIQDPADLESTYSAVLYWFNKKRSGATIKIDKNILSIERNVSETLSVIEMVLRQNKTR